MKIYFKLLLLLCYFFHFFYYAHGDDRPNIIIIMADDLGYADLGCYGGEIDTPALDTLAKNGVRFSQFYNTAKCHSSRVDLLTGMYCGQAGSSKLSVGPTIAEVLKPAGYRTMMVGKWHLDKEPTDKGFQKYFGHLSGATNFFTGDETFRLNGKKYDVPKNGFYTTDAKTDYAIRFINEAIEEETKKPFFLYLAYNAPHYPLHAPKEEVMKYRGKYKDGWTELRKKRYARQIEMGLIKKDWALSPTPKNVRSWDSLNDKEKDWEDFRMAAYAGMVDRLDQGIGRLVKTLKEKDVYDNTILMFCSDNGACPFERTRGAEKMPWDPESYWTYDTGWAHAGNTPFRWYKQNQHEGGISSPLIVHWPEGIRLEKGSISHRVGHLVDFMPTCMELAGADYTGKGKAKLMGKSFVSTLKKKSEQPHEFLYFHFGNNRAIRKGKWKVVSARGGPWELYDMEKDRTEIHDLSKSQAGITKQLSDLWFKVAKNVDNLSQKQRKPVSEHSQPWRNRG